ncbi:UNKNOWN [Stylonychia lemnae]|uniref:Uncharacterized protein n=1 Tax=Stylonychia lemnae TaxID=5949 RepID=A0A078ANX1_STYLE|nr:UNKNOWN [Stylonychia lemnae]|eukprot:CDW82658.1 UNKNOWN [Stylonychia lemnae]
MDQPKRVKRKGICKRALRPMDIYAKPIQLTYQGKESFKSTFGGIVSLIVILSLLSVSAYKVNDMILKKQTSVKKNTLVSISNSYAPPEVLSEKNITIAFMLSDFFAENTFNDPFYGKFILRQSEIYIRKNETDGTNYREFIDYYIPFSKCIVGKNFFYPNAEEVKQYGLQNYFCPDWQNLTLQGNWYSPVYKCLTLLFERCKGPNCASDDQFSKWIDGKWIQEIIISSYFDIANYENPVKYFLDDTYLAIEYNRTTYNSMYFKKDILKLSDSLVGIFDDVQEEYFYQMSHTRYFTSSDTGGFGHGVHFYQDIRLDKEYDIYERQVYSFSSLLQDIGGFYNSLFFIGLFVFGKFQNSIFFSSLISKLYQIEQVKKVKRRDSDQDNSVDLESTSGKIFDPKASVRRLNTTTSKHFSSTLMEDLKNSKWSLGKVHIRKLIDYLGYRWRLSITAQDIFNFTFQRLYICCKGKPKKVDTEISRRKIHLYNKGVNKIVRELDAINLMNKLRKLDLLLSLFLNKDQSYLLQYQKKHLIQEADSSSEEENKTQSIILRKFSDGYVKRNQANHLQKRLENILTQFTKANELSLIDKKIIHGLISKKNFTFNDNESVSTGQKNKDQFPSSSDYNRFMIDGDGEKGQAYQINDNNHVDNNKDEPPKIKLSFVPQVVPKNKKILQKKQFKKRSENDVKRDVKAKKVTVGLRDIILSDD